MIINYNHTKQEQELIASALDWCTSGSSIALVTLIGIEGNAPYPLGSQMLVDQDGQYIGQITGGCAESAIADEAASLIRREESKTVRYGLNSPYFDIKLPCGSGVDVYFDVNVNIETLADISSSLILRQKVEQVLLTRIGTFTKIYSPTPRIIVAGQGPILSQLSELSICSGFDVACVAQNAATEAMLSSIGLNYVPISETENELKLGQELDTRTAFVSLFHEHDYEANLLVQALQSDAFYIGALGSKKTHSARCELLSSLGMSDESIQRIHGPVGLNIGANTPAQIAVSILSEVIQCLNNTEVDSSVKPS